MTHMIKDSPEVLQRVQDGLSLVDTIASQLKRKLGPNADFDELVSCGRVALLELARRYDPSLGVPFRLFASPRLQGAMRDGVRQMSAIPRRAQEKLAANGDGPADPVAAAERERLLGKHVAGIATAQANGVLAKLGIDTAGDFLAVSPKTLADVASQRNQELELLERCMSTLPADEAQVVRRHLLDGVPIERLADELGLSRMKTRSLHERGYARLKKRVARAVGQ